jgi:FAD:protein FMN transferase
MKSPELKFLTFPILVMFLVFAGCRREPDIRSFRGNAQGSTYSIVYDNDRNIASEDLKIKVGKILHDFDLSLSLYNDSSILSHINRNEDVKPDTFFSEVFRKSIVISELTGGAFDVTVGPLVRAWGFGPDAHKNFNPARIDSLLKLVGMDKVSIVKGHVVKSDPRIKLDFNAIAQGYSVDVVCRFFDKLGIKNYLVEIGGEVRARGTKGDALWRIGIDKPTDNNMTPGEDLEAIIRITNRALATSGNYRKFYIENGVKYSHTIDPKTTHD